MKRAFVILVLCTLLWISPAALAAEPAGLVPGDRGDAVLRAQLRLDDLGYLDAPISGVWRAADAAALAAFAAAGGAPDALYAENAPRAAVEEEPAPAVAVYGGAMPWNEVKARLSVGKSYVLTDCYTGVIIRLSYLGGENHAEMQPVLAWDSATMTGLFSGDSPLDVRPVLLSVDGMLAAASLRSSPLVQDGAPTRVQLYFRGSGSTAFAGLPDADHAAMIQVASAGG